MNIRCPECATVFRVDPARIPPAGVRARCSRCSASFRITPDGLGDTRAPAAAIRTATPAQPERAPEAQPAGGAPQTASQSTPSAPANPVASGAGPAAPVAEPAAPASTPQPPAAPAGPAVTEQTPAELPRTPVFGSRDPNARAQRIARALVSDIVAYHPEKRDHCLATGTLRTGFRDEIMKSWEEYVAQVGLDMAKTTPYFREALNNILAGGQQVF